jgi:adenosylcobinamide-phosphate synthase
VSYAFYLPAPLIVVAVILDVLWGDPPWFPHPVRLIGRAIIFGERVLRTGDPKRDLFGGALLVISVIALSAIAAWVAVSAIEAISLSLGGLVAVLIASTSLAARSLNDAALVVEQHLSSGDEKSARRDIRALVGRDTESLDYTGLIRAAIESVGENISDGIIAPLFFLFIGGPVAAMAYKAINTLDSMIGYKDSRYFDFGRFAARLDDAANLIPARLTAVSIAVAAALSTGRGLESLRTFLSDASQHESPNAGYPEAAMAGALGVELGGNAYYDGELESRPRMGFPHITLDVAALRTSRILMWIATALILTIFFVLRFMVRSVWKH